VDIIFSTLLFWGSGRIGCSVVSTLEGPKAGVNIGLPFERDTWR
jgi:hypothetical protein